MSNFMYYLKKIRFTSNTEFNWGGCSSRLWLITALLDYAIKQLFHTLCKIFNNNNITLAREWFFPFFFLNHTLEFIGNVKGTGQQVFVWSRRPWVSTYSFKRKKTQHTGVELLLYHVYSLFVTVKYKILERDFGKLSRQHLDIH